MSVPRATPDRSGDLRRIVPTGFHRPYQLHGFDALTPIEEMLGPSKIWCVRQDPLYWLLELFRLGT